MLLMLSYGHAVWQRAYGPSPWLLGVNKIAPLNQATGQMIDALEHQSDATIVEVFQVMEIRHAM